MKKSNNKKFLFIFISVMVLPVLFITIGFSALSTILSVNGTSMMRPVGMILVMSIEPDQTTAVHNISSSHTTDTITVSSQLDNVNDEVKYNVQIRNLGQTSKTLSEIVLEEFSNSDMLYTITGLTVGDVFRPGDSVDFTITFKYKSGVSIIDNNRLNAVLKFVFDDYEAPFITVYFQPFNGDSGFFGFAKSGIKGFKRNTTLTFAQVQQISGVQLIHNVSEDQYNSAATIYGWVDGNGIFNWWSEANIVYFHPSTLKAFNNMVEILSVDFTDTSTEKVENFAHWFDKDRKLTRIIGKINTSGLKLQYNDSFDYANDEDENASSGYGLTYLFNDCNALVEVDLSEIDTTNSSDLKRMFGGCKKLTEIDVSRFNTANAKSMYWMFRNVNEVVELDLTTFDTSNVTNMFGMFLSSYKLKNIILGDNFNTGNVKHFDSMFNNLSALTTIYVKKDFEISSGSVSDNMFYLSRKLVGSAGTSYSCAYSSNHVDSSYAKIALATQRGYFTLSDENREYAIFYNYNGGTANNPITYSINTPTFSLNAPTKEGYNFVGWTGSNGNTPERSVTILQGTIGNKHYDAVFNPNVYIIQFDSNGGTGSMPFMEVTYDTYETLRSNTFNYEDHYFIGWNTEANGTGINYDNAQTIFNMVADGIVTLYAQWAEVTNLFPKKFDVSGPCIFNGNVSNISGDTCSQYSSVKYINTGIQLFNSDNINKDFEIGLSIEGYLPSNQNETQATFLNVKLENSSAGYPGFTLRRNGNNIELTGRFGSAKPIVTFSAADVSSIKIARKDKKLYYSINDGAWTLFQDISSFNTTFDTPVTFGSSLNTNGTPMRIIKDTTLLDMYIKVGIMDDLVTQ